MTGDRLPGDRIIRRARRPKVVRPAFWVGGRRSDIAAGSPDSVWTQVVRYGATLAVLLLATALLVPLRESIGLLNIALVYLIAVIAITVLAGRWSGLLASLAGFLLFNFFQVPPYYTFAVGDLHNILALFVFLGVSLLLSWLIAGAREQAWQAERRAQDLSRLYELSQAIVGARSIDDVLPAIVDKVREVLEAEACWVLLPGVGRHLEVRAVSPAGARSLTRDEMGSAEWSFAEGRPVEHGTGAVGSRSVVRSGRVAFAPLEAVHGTGGVLAVASGVERPPLARADWAVLGTFADQAAVAIERLSLLREAQKAEALRRADELKSALVSAVSHDLRTPLSSIVASVTSLLEPDIQWDAETRKDFLEGIYDEAVRLNRLVGNLLDMSKIEGGALRPEKDWYSIGEVVGAVTERLESRLHDHPVMLKIPASLPLVPFDFTKIDQVLTNLLENVINHTPSGTPVTVEARQIGQMIEVTVEDRGPGVLPEHLPRLFDKFYRVGRGRASGGTGLGLAITRGLVEAHGGMIRAGLPPGGGLRVSFTLPLQSPENRDGSVSVAAGVGVGDGEPGGVGPL